MFRTLLCLTAATLVTGCALIEDDITIPGERQHPQSDVRGFTYCGQGFDGAVYCSPGQYCEHQEWNDCEQGCLSDVNCASNQYCDIRYGDEVGTCVNAYHSTVGALEADAGFSYDAGGGADAGGSFDAAGR